MSKISLTLATSLIIVTGIIGYGIGYAMTPEYRVGMFDKTSMNLGKPDRWLDQRYVNAMISHHRGAMLLAEQAAKNGQRKEIKDLASKILTDEPAAIQELYSWKQSWYGDTRRVKDPAVSNLGGADASFDLRFLNALIAHHENGLVMTKDVMTKTSRAEVLNNANTVDTFLSSTLELFQDWRKQWYNI